MNEVTIEQKRKVKKTAIKLAIVVLVIYAGYFYIQAIN